MPAGKLLHAPVKKLLQPEIARHLRDAQANYALLRAKALQPERKLVPDLVRHYLILRVLKNKAYRARLLALRRLLKRPAVEIHAALELSVAMPLSWLPLVADYTKDAQRPVAASAASAAIYTVVSCWMYAIGLGVAMAGIADGFAASVREVGVGVAGVLVIVFSTVTTTFLDAYSAGESAKSLWSRLPAKGFGVAVCVVGTLLAIFVGMDHYLDFLYLIASVFAPMAAVQMVDWAMAKGPGDDSPAPPLHRPRTPRAIGVNLVAWLVGLAVYHLSLHFNSPFGATLPAMAASAAIAAVNRRASLTTNN